MSLQPPPADPSMLPNIDNRDFEPFMRTTAALYPLFKAGLLNPASAESGKHKSHTSPPACNTSPTQCLAPGMVRNATLVAQLVSIHIHGRKTQAQRLLS